MLKKNALNADSVRKAPATPISAEPATIAPVRIAATVDALALGRRRVLADHAHARGRAACGRARQASSGTSSSASSVSGVCAASTGMRQPLHRRERLDRRRRVDLRKAHAVARSTPALVANSVMPSPDTCCDSASGTVRSACSRPNAAPVSAATAHAGPQRRARVDREPAGEGARDHDPLDAEVQHAGALAQQHAERAEDQRRGDAQHRDPEGGVAERCRAMSLMLSASAPGSCVEQRRDQHRDQRDRDDHVGDVGRHADRAAHAVGADQHAGDEDGGRDARRADCSPASIAMTMPL